MEIKEKFSFSGEVEENSTLQWGEYHQLVSGLPAAVYTCDTKGRITFYNEAAALLWGRKPKLGMDLWCGSWKIYDSEGNPLALDKCPMAVTLREGKAVLDTEIIIERPDGVKRNVIPFPRPMIDSTGKISGAVNMLIDITENKAAEHRIRESEKRYRDLANTLESKISERTSILEKRNEQLRTSEEQYHKMVEEVQDYAILLLSAEGTILNWNKGAEKIKGYKAHEIIGKNFSNFYLLEDRLDNLPQKLINLAKSEGRAAHEGWRVRKDGSRFWGSIVITSLVDDEGKTIGYSKVTRDLTERKLAEDKLKEYTKELETQNRELEQYAFISSHDLQEPLRKIQVYSSLLEKNLDDKELSKKHIEKINSSAKRMTFLIRDVLNYTRLSKTDEQFEAIDLNETLENVKQDFEVLISEKNAIIRNTVLPTINGIPIQLQQLFSNLISNSLKFNDFYPLIEITSSIVPNDELKNFTTLNPEKTYILLSFKDNGIGIEPHHADQIFKLFQSLNDRNKYAGTGLGLALCKKIVANHQGLIEVESKLYQGATFKVYLPL